MRGTAYMLSHLGSLFVDRASPHDVSSASGDGSNAIHRVWEPTLALHGESYALTGTLRTAFDIPFPALMLLAESDKGRGCGGGAPTTATSLPHSACGSSLCPTQ